MHWNIEIPIMAYLGVLAPVVPNQREILTIYNILTME